MRLVLKASSVLDVLTLYIYSYETGDPEQRKCSAILPLDFKAIANFSGYFLGTF